MALVVVERADVIGLLLVLSVLNAVLQLVRDSCPIVIMMLSPLLLVDVLEMATKVAALGEGLVAIVTRERPLPSMLPEVVPQVARLLEDTVAARVHTLKVQFDSLGVGVPNLDGLVPFLGNAFEGL